MPAFLMDIEGGVATMRLNRPEAKNALNTEIYQGLEKALLQIREDRDVRAVVLTGSGGVFCAGGDVKVINANADSDTPEARRDRLRGVHRVIKLLADLDRPLVAAVDGPAYGAGFSLALFADMVLATPRARFCMVFARIGFIPDYGALYTLPRVVGLNRAKDLMLSGRELGAQEAREIGVVNEIVDADRLEGRTRQVALALASASPVAATMTKIALNRSLSMDLDTMLEYEAAHQGIAAASSYAKDAVQRFADKKPPAFQWPKAPISPTHQI